LSKTSDYQQSSGSHHSLHAVGVLTFDRQGQVLTSNALLNSLLGYNTYDLTSLNIYQLIPDLQLTQHTNQLRHFPAKHKKGHTSPIEFLVQPADFHDQTIYTLLFRHADTETIYPSNNLANGSAILNSMPDGVITTDKKGKINFINHSALSLTGWTEQEAIKKQLSSIFKLINEQTREPEPDLAHKTLVSKQEHISSDNILLRNKADKEFNIEYNASLITDAHKVLQGVVISFRDISEKHRMLRQIAWQAHHDPLTGLINRKEMENRLDLSIISAKHNKREHALLYIDLDQFKVVNDTCGHQAGDELLRQISGQLGANLRHRDALGRLGGDEFGILLENCSIEQAQQIAESIKDAVMEYRFIWENKIFQIGASIGVVAINHESSCKSQILSDADAACYAAKDAGRNRVQLYNPDDYQLAMQRREMHWASNINQVIDENRFRLFFQRVQPIGRGQPLYWEVLIRMINENKELILPGAFLPAAERFDLMENIDRWVLSSTLKLLHDLDSNKKTLPFLSINLSAHSLGDEKFLDFALEQFSRLKIAPAQICFEITETAAIANFTQAREFVRTMGNAGCKFALDDFGSGMSSFSYLKNLPVDYIKIDGSFVRNINRDIVDLAMVESINRISHLMKIETIAEGAESASILNQLADIGVGYAQGNGIQQPLSMPEFLNSLSFHPIHA